MRSIRIQGFSVAILALLITACGTTPPSSTPAVEKKKLDVIRIGSFSTAIDYSPYIVARTKKWFEEAFAKEGTKVEYATFETLPSINESLASDRVDAIFEAEPPAIIAKAAGIDIQVVGISATLVQEIVVPAKSNVRMIKDLRGKKVGVLAGTSSHYGLLKLARQAGLPDGSIQVIDLKPPDAKGAFETGAIDAWAVWPPWEEQEVVSGKGRTLTGGDAQIQSILAVSGKLAKVHPEAVCSLISTLDRAKKWIRDNPSEAQELIAKELNLPMKVVELAWPQHDWSAELSDTVKSDIQEKATFLRAKQLIAKAVSVADGFVQRPLCPVN